MKSKYLLALLLVTLAGCSGFRSREPAAQTYLLTLAPGSAAAAAPASPTLAVMLPRAAPGLDSDRIALQTADGRMSYYSASRWTADLPVVLQTLLIDSLRQRGGWRAVLADGAPFGADLLLQIEVRHFEAEYTGSAAPNAHVLLEATLGQRGSRAIVRTVRAESRVPASADRMSAVVAAFNAALNDALSQLQNALAAPAPGG